jgi:hypothetical protein
MDLDYLWWVSAASQGLVLGRMSWLRLLKRYPFFVSFLAAGLIRSGILLFIGQGNKKYTYTWVATEPLLLILMLTAAVEGLRLTLEAYPGRRNAFTALLIAFAGLAVVFMVLTSGLDFATPGDRWPVLHFMAIARRSLTGSLAVFLLGATCWLTWLPVPERENVRLHRLLLTVYFGSAAVSQLAINVGLSRPAMNGAALAASILCYCGWLFFKASGETQPEASPLTDKEFARIESEARDYRQLLR